MFCKGVQTKRLAFFLFFQKVRTIVIVKRRWRDKTKEQLAFQVMNYVKKPAGLTALLFLRLESGRKQQLDHTFTDVFLSVNNFTAQSPGEFLAQPHGCRRFSSVFFQGVVVCGKLKIDQNHFFSVAERGRSGNIQYLFSWLGRLLPDHITDTFQQVKEDELYLLFFKCE